MVAVSVASSYDCSVTAAKTSIGERRVRVVVVKLTKVGSLRWRSREAAVVLRIGCPRNSPMGSTTFKEMRPENAW